MASQSGNHDIARRYAKAFFELAQEQSQIDQISKDMDAVAALVASGGDFTTFTDNATLKRADQVKAIGAIAKHLKLSALSEKFLGLLASKRRLPALGAIVAAVHGLIAEQKGEVTAEVTAAQTLDQKQLADIAAHLKKVTGKNVKVVLSVNPEIMGGLVVKVGSKLMDSSVRTKLDRLHRALKNSNELSSQKKMKEVA